MPKVRNYLNRPVQKTKEFRKLSFETLENRELLAATPWNQATGIYGPPSLEQLTQFSETVVASSASASNLEASESSDDTLRFEILEETVYENPSSAANSVENAPSPNQLIFDENEPYYNEEEIIACVSSNAVNYQGVSSVALVGYSHGGGTVYNLAYRMYYDGQNGNLQKITNSYDLDFTSYIDAISNSSNANPLALDELPLGTQFHVNQYETNSRIDGCSIPESDVNIDRTGLDLEHSNDDPTISIDTNVLVQTTLTVYYLTHVER